MRTTITLAINNRLRMDKTTPDWNNAPSEWDWLAQDEDGRWFWYAVKPVPGFGVWRSPSRLQQFAGQGDVNPDWLSSLQQRPVHALSS